MQKKEYKVTYRVLKTCYIFAENDVEADRMAMKEVKGNDDAITLLRVDEVVSKAE